MVRKCSTFNGCGGRIDLKNHVVLLQITFATRLLFFCSRRFNRRKRNVVDIATPSLFQEKMAMWRDLIKLEIKAETDSIKLVTLFLFYLNFIMSLLRSFELIEFAFFRQYLREYSWDDLLERGLALGNLTLISESYHPVLGHFADFKPAKAVVSSRHFKTGKS